MALDLAVLTSLPRSTETWEMIAFPAPGTPGDATGAHFILVAAPGGRIRTFAQTPQTPTHGEWLAAVHAAIVASGPGLSACRPRRLLVTDQALAQRLHTPMRACGIPVEVTHKPAAAAQALLGLQDLLRNKGWGTPTGVPADLERELCKQAARIAALAPWTRLLDRQVFLLQVDFGPWHTPVASVLGAAGEVYGIALYRDHATWTRYDAAARAGRSDAAASIDAMLVAFDRDDDVSADVRKAFTDKRLATAGGWYPIPTRLQPGSPPAAVVDEDDAGLLSDCLHALADLFEQALSRMPETYADSRTTTASGTQVHVLTSFGYDASHPLSNNLGKRPAQHIVGSMSRSWLQQELGLDLRGPAGEDRAPAYVMRATKADAQALKLELAQMDTLGVKLSHVTGMPMRMVAGLHGTQMLGELIHRDASEFDDSFLRQSKQFGGRAALLILSGGAGRRLAGFTPKQVVEARMVDVVELA